MAQSKPKFMLVEHGRYFYQRRVPLEFQRAIGRKKWRAPLGDDFDAAYDRLTVLETKGDQLDNADTAYKRDLLSVLSDSFSWDQTKPSGELELITATGETVECSLILISEWQASLPKYLSSEGK